VYLFPQYDSWRIVLLHYELCWFLVIYGFDKYDSKFSLSQSEKVFSYTWLLSNSLAQSGHQQHHTTRPEKEQNDINLQNTTQKTKDWSKTKRF
jgi:hypothetical protein